MALAYKQLTRQIGRNKIFASLLLILTILTSLSFFFVIFSIDGNMARLNALYTLTENQELYRNALNANTSLAYMFLISTIGLTAFVFVMFFYRFFRSNKRQIGCLKALGFRDNSLRLCFVVFVGVLSIVGAVLGLIGGYFLSDVLINDNMQTYMVTDLVKEASLLSLVLGLIIPALIFCITAFLCYSFVGGKEPGALIAGNSNHARFSFTLRIANGISRLIPVKNKFPYRIALRKPLAVTLILVAVMTFNVFIILGYSINISSDRIIESQTIGHNYEYNTRFAEYQINPLPENAALNSMPYLESTVELIIGRHEIQQAIFGLHNLNEVFRLQNANGDILPMPDAGMVLINPFIAEIHGVNIGDTLIANINGAEHSFFVSGIATNAKSATIYVNADELATILGVPIGAYNGVLSMERIPGGETTTRAERAEELNRNAVSNNISAVINQTIGGIVGAILIFLALYVNFQDNTRDMLILHMMGYRVKNIRKLLIDVYMPIVWAAFVITLVPSILLARFIQTSLSMAMGEYMPFGTNGIVILIVFLLLNFVYWLVQLLFGIGTKRTIAKEEMSEFVYAE